MTAVLSAEGPILSMRLLGFITVVKIRHTMLRVGSVPSEKK